MDPIREHIEQLTRRHFFGRTGLSLGTAALASLLGESARSDTTPTADVRLEPDRRPAGPASFPAQGQAGHLPVHERRPVADGPVRLQAEDGRDVRQGPARVDPQGPAADHHDQRPVPVPGRPVQVQVRPARPGRHVGQRALALHGPDRRRHRAGQDRLHRGDQPRPGGHLHLHRQPAPGPPQPGLLAELRPGDDEPEPAGLRGDDRVVVGHAGRRRRSTTGSGAPAICPASIKGWRCGPRATRCSSCRTPTGVDAATRRRMLDALNRHEPPRARASSPTPRPRPGSPSTRWRSGCRPRSPSWPTSRASRSTSSTCTGPTSTRRGPSRAAACWPAGWSSATSGSSRSSTAAGTSTATSPATCHASASDVDQPTLRTRSPT